MRLLLLCMFVAAVAGYKTYSGYRVLQVTPTTEAHVDGIKQLRQDIALDFWDDRRQLGLPTKIMVPPHKLDVVTHLLDTLGATYTTVIDDVGVDVIAERERLEARAAQGMVFDINDFNTYDDIMTEIDLMAGRCPAALTCVVDTVGSSDGGQPIRTLRISGGSGRQGYWLDTAIHAREWIAPATNLKIMDSFTRNYGTDPDVTNLIDSYDWHFTPIMNPDGYEWSWTDDRMWRKSRNSNDGSLCIGTDLNRNYDVNWMNDGTDSSPCSDVYGGEAPESAVETASISAEIRRVAPTLRAFLSIHTAAEMWLHPWGHTNQFGQCVFSEHQDDLTTVVTAAIDAVRNTYNDINWTAGNTCETIYPASGTTGDYAAAANGGNMKYTFTPELRGPNFVAPPEDIELSYQETWNGLKALVAEIEAVEGAPIRA